MPLQVPNLDDRRWDQLVEEARSLIPRFSPPWTDHNVHDPGVTFIELFAWLAEMQMYQLNRVGNRHREAFAKLAGVPPQLREPAAVNVWLPDDFSSNGFLPAGTQLTPLEGDEIVFETARDVFLTLSRLTKVLVGDGLALVDQTKANKKFGVTFLAFGENAREGAELRLGFNEFYPRDEKELWLAFDVFSEDLAEPCDPAGPLALTDQEEEALERRPAAEIVWEYQRGPEAWAPLRPVRALQRGTGSFDFSRGGFVVLPVPERSAQVDGLHWIRCRIQRGHYDIEPRLRSIGVNVLTCRQAETVRREPLGDGDGRPNQSFDLARQSVLTPDPNRQAPLTSSDVADWRHLDEHFKRRGTRSSIDLGNVIRESFSAGVSGLPLYERIKALREYADRRAEQLTSHEAVEAEAADELDSLLGRVPVVIEVAGELWKCTSSFECSGPEDRQYTFDADRGCVAFGNGLNGRIPRRGQQIVALWYRASSGSSGNVAKNLRWKFRSGGFPGVSLTNPHPASGGKDPEDLDATELRARARLHRPQRAVTLGDLEYLALTTPGVHVARAKAVPNCPTPETITVVVVPKIRPGRRGAPKPVSAALLDAVRLHLQKRRLIGDDLRVIGAKHVEVQVSATLRAKKGAGLAKVRQRAEQALEQFLKGEIQPAEQAAKSESPTDAISASSPCPTRWPFGRAVFPSEIYAILDGARGVDSVSAVELSAHRPGSKDKTGAIQIPPIALVYGGQHQLSVESGRRGDK